MKIWGDIPKISEIYNQYKKTQKIDKTNEIHTSKDVVSISNAAKDYQIVEKALKSVPDIRKDKINELEQKYSTGKYRVDGREIADKVLKSIFDKKI